MEPISIQAAGFLGLGAPEVAIIVLLAVFMFGPKKIPELAKGLGEGIRNFKTSLKGDDEDPKKGDDKVEAKK